MPKKRKSTDQDGLYQRPNSRYWWATFIDANGRRVRRSTGTSARSEAAALLAKWKLAAYQERHWDAEPTRTFEELMTSYLKKGRAEKRPMGFRRDQDAIRHLRAFFGGSELQGLTPAKVRAYIDTRRSLVCDTTINRELCVLSAAINYARIELEWDISNPVAGRKLREPEGRVRWLRREEADRLIQEATREPQAPHLADFIRLALNTGCRKGELLGLEWNRVDFEAGLIHLAADHTKTARRRSIPLNRDALAALRALKRFRDQHCPTSSWVFCHSDGGRVGDVKRSFSTALRRAEIDNFRVHDLRHTCAAWLVSAGIPLSAVRDLLGHTTVRMTERYAHLAPENVRTAIESLIASASHSGHSTELKVIEGGRK